MARKHLPDRLGTPPKANVMTMDDYESRARVKALVDKIAAESKFVTKLYINSAGRAVINVSDPEFNIRPFAVRDEAEWDERMAQIKVDGNIKAVR